MEMAYAFIQGCFFSLFFVVDFKPCVLQNQMKMPFIIIAFNQNKGFKKIAVLLMYANIPLRLYLGEWVW